MFKKKKKAKPPQKFSSWSRFQITAEPRCSQEHKPQRLIFNSERRCLTALFRQEGAVKGYVKANTGADAGQCIDEGRVEERMYFRTTTTKKSHSPMFKVVTKFFKIY